MDWSHETCLQLIEMYRLKAELWQPTHSYHHNKIKKHDAWTEIAKDIKSTVDTVKAKINSLLSSFRREKLKEENSVGTGKGRDEVYRSKWFAYEAFRFLMDKNKVRKTINTTTTPKNFQEEEVENEVFKDVHPEENNNIENASFAKDEVHISLENIQNIQEPSQKNFVSPKKTKKRKAESESDPRIAEALNIMKTCTQRDACEIYGEHIAMKLRSYDKQTQSIVQHHVNNILFNADIGQYNNYMNTNVNYPNGACYNSRSSPPNSQPPSPYFSEAYSPQLGYTDIDDTITKNANMVTMENTIVTASLGPTSSISKNACFIPRRSEPCVQQSLPYSAEIYSGPNNDVASPQNTNKLITHDQCNK